MNNTRVKHHIKDHIASVILNNPENKNLIDAKMAGELLHIFKQIEDNDTVKVILLTGTAAYFSIGRTQIPADLGRTNRELNMSELKVCDMLSNLKSPIVASINGDATEHGLELALCADIRLCCDESHFRINDLFSENSFPWDGGTQRLPRLIGQSWALDMLLTGRTISAQEALSIGLVNKVTSRESLDEESHTVAHRICMAGQIANQYVKEAVYKGSEMSLEQGLRLEADLNIILQSTKDRTEGINSFNEKRSPNFTGE
jgi:enoyl-CoA hydratase/carnithine racemase